SVMKSGFNKNILLFGGLGVAALIGIYFLTKKK
ncbi:MAG: LPXTG cell wall anchor domain-containing protein, partial [Proteobacteria bacterium]|nr:LPXTG cell wall anchor domain-containing protein [Pseudomonadota bacterium]